MKICYYNPDDASMPIQEVLKEVCLNLNYELITGIGNTAWLNNYDIAIIHGRVRTLVNEGLEFIGYSELMDPLLISKPNQTLIFISSASTSNERQKIELLNDNGFRYLLPVKNTMESGLIAQTEVEESAAIEKWKQLLEVVTNNEIIEKWFGAKDTNNLLSELFLEQESFYLITLTVLCQGFLATQFSLTSQNTTDVMKKAFVDMGLDKGFIGSSEIEKLKEQVSNPEWWRNIFSEDKNIVIQKLLNEWKSESVSANVLQLIEKIYSESDSESDSENLISSDLVAESYLDIAQKLRGK